jgi:hypothetical protein
VFAQGIAVKLIRQLTLLAIRRKSWRERSARLLVDCPWRGIGTVARLTETAGTRKAMMGVRRAATAAEEDDEYQMSEWK